METNISKRGVTGSTLKIIALITMLIDHIGAGILGRYIVINGVQQINFEDAYQWEAWKEVNAKLYYSYVICRFIGRIAFPIFCFLLVEGFTHTSNKKRYASRLVIFAFISEVPFDLFIFGKPFCFSYQNIFFTLLIGLLTMMIVDVVLSKVSMNKMVAIITTVVIVILGMLIAKILRTDYDYIGVLCIMLLYFTRKSRVRQIIVGSLSFLWEITAVLAFIPIGYYNGKRGLNIKYLFYAFYPVHILIIYLICLILGIQGANAY